MGNVAATAHIPEIIKITEELIKKGFAYNNQGNVYFEVSKFKEYGKLSRYEPEKMLRLLKERGGNPSDILKRDSLDFILWQKSEAGEPWWESPWGRGRPGWHIECSAMIHDTLGEQIDIHGGGYDLIFPHNESEIAQSESYTGTRPFARYFMHTAMVHEGGQKMAKSTGNLIMVSDILKRYDPMALRWVLLSHHYRTEWECEENELIEAQKIIGQIRSYNNSSESSQHVEYMSKFESLMSEDMNVPAVLELIYESVIGGAVSSDALRKTLNVLGFKM